MLQEVYGDDAMSRSHVFQWHRRFHEGREDVDDDPRAGRPATSKTEEIIQQVRQVVCGDRRLTVRIIADEVGINHNAVWEILTQDLGMRKICANLSHLLNDLYIIYHLLYTAEIFHQTMTQSISL